MTPIKCILNIQFYKVNLCIICNGFDYICWFVIRFMPFLDIPWESVVGSHSKRERAKLESMRQENNTWIVNNIKRRVCKLSVRTKGAKPILMLDEDHLCGFSWIGFHVKPYVCVFNIHVYVACCYSSKWHISSYDHFPMITSHVNTSMMTLHESHWKNT